MSKVAHGAGAYLLRVMFKIYSNVVKIKSDYTNIEFVLDLYTSFLRKGFLHRRYVSNYLEFLQFSR